MAYAGKRGRGPQPWRVKYKLPDGTEVSESGFETKTAALTWGRDQEARIREGRWTDPNAGKTTVGQWIDRWLTMQDMGISTAANREYRIRRFLRPAWGQIMLSAMTTEAITWWENGLPAREGISRRTAADARSLLGTILGDAAAHKPPLIPYNPALRPRNRGRKTGRRLARSPQRAWATPLQALLLAERAALLTGRDDDFTLILTLAYTGLRWGEVIGLEHSYLHPAEIRVEWQIREIGGRFYRIRPRTTPTAAPTGSHACRSISRRSWAPCSPGRPRAARGSGASALRSTAAAAGTCSPPRTAGITGGATTAAGCSAPPATDGTSPSTAARPGSSPSTPPPGPASRLPPGQPWPRAAKDGAPRRGMFRHAGAGSGSSRMAFRWPPGSRWFPA
jgi:hypothetical protein